VQGTQPSAVPSEAATTSRDVREVAVTPTELDEVRVVNPSSSMTVDPDSLYGTNIIFWHPWTGDAATLVDELTEEFNRENVYGIGVSAVSQGRHLFEVVRKSLNTGQFPNFVLARTHELISWQQTRDILLDLDDYIRDPDYGLSESVIMDFQPLYWEQDIFNGVRLGVPSHGVSTLIAYNVSWSRELGFDSLPTTLERFKSQACAAADASIGNSGIEGNGGLITRIDPSVMMSWIMAFAGDVTTKSGEGYTFYSTEVMDGFYYLKSLFMEGCAWNPDIPYTEEEFAARKGLFYATSVLDLPFITAAFEHNGTMDSWMVLPYPTKEGYGLINIIPFSYGILETIPEEQLAAWLYLKWMVEPENQAAMVEVSSVYPVRISAIPILNKYRVDHPQWGEAQKLLPHGMVEPRLSTWSFARWAVSDAGREMISPGFASGEIPALLEELNRFDKDKGQYFALDMKSKHGVFINGGRINNETALADGDQIYIGQTDLLFTEKDFANRESALSHFKKVGERFRPTMIE